MSMFQNILLLGGTGFIGTELSRSLLDEGHTLWVLVHKKQPKMKHENLHVLNDIGDLPKGLESLSVVNLSGQGIADRPWTTKRKQQLIDSRIQPMQVVISELEKRGEQLVRWIQGSAIGFYGYHGSDRQLSETDEPANDFGSQLCQKVEKEAENAKTVASKVIMVRTGLVLGKKGLMARLKLPFLFGFGGRMGDGQQMMSWIHINDEVGILRSLVNGQLADYDPSSESVEVWNAVAPKPVTNETFSRALAKTLNRPYWFHLPALPLKWGMGEMSDLLLRGQRVSAKKLVDHGYKFNFESVDQALENLSG